MNYCNLRKLAHFNADHCNTTITMRKPYNTAISVRKPLQPLHLENYSI